MIKIAHELIAIPVVQGRLSAGTGAAGSIFSGQWTSALNLYHCHDDHLPAARDEALLLEYGPAALPNTKGQSFSFVYVVYSSFSGFGNSSTFETFMAASCSV